MQSGALHSTKGTRVPFTTDLVVRERDDGQSVLVEDLRYTGKREEFVVAEGFVTNFASIPRPFWWLAAPYGKHAKAAVLHDHLWRQANAGEFDRSDADGIFRRALRELDVPFLRRGLMWAAVRVAGLVTSHRGSWDLRQVLQVVMFFVVGLVVLVGGLAVVGFLIVFYALEAIAWPFVALAARRAGEQVNRPRVLSRPRA